MKPHESPRINKKSIYGDSWPVWNRGIREYSKTCVKMPFSKSQKIGFQDQLSLNEGQKYCSNESILQYFSPSLTYHLSLRSLFCLFLSGRFTLVLM